MAEDPTVKFATATASRKKQPDVIDEILMMLRKFLGYCLCVLTGGCVPPPGGGRLNDHEYDSSLSDLEREAVSSLLNYLDSKAASESPVIDEERLRALCVLTYSDNVELQRSAALCFAEISDKMRRPLSLKAMDPLNVLLQSRDSQVHTAASLAVSNFALDGSVENRAIIVDSGSLPGLVHLLSSASTDVQCNACACLTTLITLPDVREQMVSMKAVHGFVVLARSPDLRVQRNAVGAVLNLTHLRSSRDDLVKEGAIPVLVEVQASKDPDVQYYSTAALSNLAVTEKHRTMMIAVGYYDVIRQLIVLVTSSSEKVRCQACLALRNLACDADNQLIIVKYDGLAALKRCVAHARGDTLSAAMACLRNLSVHRSNEVPIICETFLSSIETVLTQSNNVDAQKHAAGIIRNLAAGEHVGVIIRTGNVEALCDVLVRTGRQLAAASVPMLTEVTAALAILADEEEVKHQILTLKSCAVFSKLVEMALHAPNSELRYNCSGTIGQLCVVDIPVATLSNNTPAILAYMKSFIETREPSFIHISLWTLLHLLNDQHFLSAYRQSPLPTLVESLTNSAPSDAIQELAQTVQAKARTNDNASH